MSPQGTSFLWVGCGLMAMGRGLLTATGCRQELRRILRASKAVQASLPEGWGAWFFRGFSQMTTGVRCLVRMALFAFWVVLGTGLVSIGLRVVP